MILTIPHTYVIHFGDGMGNKRVILQPLQHVFNGNYRGILKNIYEQIRMRRFTAKIQFIATEGADITHAWKTDM